MRATIFLRTVITLDGEYTLVRVDIQKSDGAASRRRDKFVAGALGVKKYHKVKYQTVAQRLTGLLPPGSKGVNHGMTPPIIYVSSFVHRLAIDIPTDGVTVLLTVTIVP